jgi:large subunit ribosomal protein L7/L12
VNRQNKEAFIKEMKNNINQCSAAYLIDMCGLTVRESSELRRQIKKHNSVCKVVKNRLLKIAAKEENINGLEQYLRGPLAMVFVKGDPTPVAKILLDYTKKFKSLGLKGVILEKKVYPQENISKIATLPPKEIMLQQLLGVLQSPVLRLLFILSSVVNSFLTLLKTIQQQKSEGKEILGGTTMSNISKEDVINYLLGLSVIELSQFIKEFEEKTGIKAAAVVAPAAMSGPASAGAAEAKPAEEEKTEFDVFLTSVGDKKINVIKVLRDLTNMGLKEAKELIDNVPRLVKEGVPKEEAEKMKKKFEEAGATVEIK